MNRTTRRYRALSTSELADRIQSRSHQTTVVVKPFDGLPRNSDLVNRRTDVEDWLRPLLSPDHRFRPDMTFPIGPECHVEGIWPRLLARSLKKRIFSGLFVGIFQLTQGNFAYSISAISL